MSLDRSGISAPLPLLLPPVRSISHSPRLRARYHARIDAINRTNNCIRSTNRMLFGSTCNKLYPTTPPLQANLTP
jgi:hypothetical protein